MIAGSLGLAFVAGMVAALNPCGFALLPAYLGLFLDAPSSRWLALRRAASATAAMTVGFVAVFGLLGLVIVPVLGQIQRYLPLAAVLLGLVLALAGIWVLLGHRLPTISVPTVGGSPSGQTWSMIMFGASYALASFSCTIAPFLAAVLVATRASSMATGVLAFVAYALGMGLVVGTAAIAVSLASSMALGRLRGFGRFVPRLGGLMLLVTGGYVAYYGWWEWRALSGQAGSDGIVTTATAIQHWLTAELLRFGAVGVLIILVVLVLIALLGRRSPTSR